MNCRKCGAVIPEGSAFCVSCGHQTGDPTAQTVAISMMSMEDPLLIQLREQLADDYEVEKELGRGGMAIVFKGREKGLDRVVALKVLPPEMAMSGGTADRFKREARLAAALDHPHIIPIYRVGQSGNLHYMAMKFVEGKALDELIERQGALPINICVRVLQASASALAFAHDNSIIHRDIKGGNILIDRDGRVMVSDFGIARAMGEASLTASGMVIGTPNYMSPEQCGGLQVGPQADQYSLGVLAFQMLTGQLPFEAESIMGVIQHHYLTPPPDITKVRGDVPEELLDIVYKAMAKAPADRYESTQLMAEAFEKVQLTEDERRDCTNQLKMLAQGEKIESVRTGSLPPLKVSGPGGATALGGASRPGTTGPRAPKAVPKVAPAPPPPAKKSPALMVALVATVALGGAGAAYWALVLNKADAGTGTTPVQALGPQTVAPVAVNGPGAVEFRGLPPNATVTVGGRVLEGGKATFPTGTYEYKVTAPGYQELVATFRITAGETFPIDVTMIASARQPATPTQTAPPPNAVTGETDLRIATTDQTLSAEIFLDDKSIGKGRFVGKVTTGPRHRLRIVLSGFQAFDTTFVARLNETVSLTGIVLKPAGGS